jgi:beta-galactosidase GanA
LTTIETDSVARGQIGWHVSNEYGVNSQLGQCYGPAAGPAWRAWLERRYGMQSMSLISNPFGQWILCAQ